MPSLGQLNWKSTKLVLYHVVSLVLLNGNPPSTKKKKYETLPHGISVFAELKSTQLKPYHMTCISKFADSAKTENWNFTNNRQLQVGLHALYQHSGLGNLEEMLVPPPDPTLSFLAGRRAWARYKTREMPACINKRSSCRGSIFSYLLVLGQQTSNLALLRHNHRRPFNPTTIDTINLGIYTP